MIRFSFSLLAVLALGLSAFGADMAPMAPWTSDIAPVVIPPYATIPPVIAKKGECVCGPDCGCVPGQSCGCEAGFFSSIAQKTTMKMKVCNGNSCSLVDVPAQSAASSYAWSPGVTTYTQSGVATYSNTGAGWTATSSGLTTRLSKPFMERKGPIRGLFARALHIRSRAASGCASCGG